MAGFLNSRFIPACAGNGSRHSMSPGDAAVHPRVCGERDSATGKWSYPSGSSPRVRGTVVFDNLRHLFDRFIPACAGNGGSGPSMARGRPVHPRVCGERPRPTSPDHRDRGSSPRVRGTAAYAPLYRASKRFIPACAGNGSRLVEGLTGESVHPRVCGERRIGDGEPFGDRGSSPRVRGTVAGVGLGLGENRFIPACAGNGITTHLPSGHRAVHPRVCGERPSPVPGSNRRTGSSPRVRGTGRAAIVAAERLWFIPACAGNGFPQPPTRPPAPVHPRVCGERDRHHLVERQALGSSPRVRGTADRAAIAARCPRFIPACAGNGPRRFSLPARARFIPACAGNGLQHRHFGRLIPVHPRVCGERDSCHKY